MPQLKQINPLGASITSHTIISNLFFDPKLNEMLSKFNAGGGQEDLKSELFAVLCEKENDFICDLWAKKQLLFYCTGIVQRMIFQPGNRFHRRYRTQSYEFTEAILNTTDEAYNIDKENRLQDLEAAMDKDLHWVEKSMIKLHQDLGSMEKISKVTKISFNQVDRIYKKAKEKLRTSLSGKLMGNYIVVTNEFVLDIPQDVTPDNINDILDETLEYMRMRLEGRMIPSKEKTNGYIKDIKPLKAKKVI
jgi:hypothetical protein